MLLMLVGLWFAMPAIRADETTPAEPPATTPQVPDPVAAPSGNLLGFLPKVVATVGEREITREELIREANSILGRMAARGQEQRPPEAELRQFARQILSGIIERDALLACAARDGFRPTPEKGEEEYRKLTEEIPPDQLAALLANQKMTEAELKSQLALAAALRDWFDQLATSIVVNDADIKAYYDSHPDMFQLPESVTVAHILVEFELPPAEELAKLTPEERERVQSEARMKAKARAEAILKRIRAGEDFGRLAEAESACPSGKRDQGRLAEFVRGDMVKPFEDAAFALEMDTISEPVETKFGFHLIKKLGHQPVRLQPLEDVAERLKEEMQRNSVDEKIKRLLRREKKANPVKIMI